MDAETSHPSQKKYIIFQSFHNTNDAMDPNLNAEWGFVLEASKIVLYIFIMTMRYGFMNSIQHEPRNATLRWLPWSLELFRKPTNENKATLDLQK